jgi:hypothetical protein
MMVKASEIAFRRTIKVSETAFVLRQDHLMVELIAAWEPQDDE